MLYTLNTDFMCSMVKRFCFITMISSRLDGRVSKAIASEVDHLGLIPSPAKPKAHKLVFTASIFDTQH